MTHGAAQRARARAREGSNAQRCSPFPAMMSLSADDASSKLLYLSLRPALPDDAVSVTPLPIDLVLHWALRGDVATMGVVAAVCREWREAASLPYLWRSLDVPCRISKEALLTLVKRFHGEMESVDLSCCYNLTTSGFAFAFADLCACSSSLSSPLNKLTHLDLALTNVSAVLVAHALRSLRLKLLVVHGIPDERSVPGASIPLLKELTDELDVSTICANVECDRLCAEWKDDEPPRPELGGRCDACHESFCQYCLDVGWLGGCGACKEPLCDACCEESCDDCLQMICTACTESADKPFLYSCEACGKTSCARGDNPCAFTIDHFRLCDDCGVEFVRHRPPRSLLISRPFLPDSAANARFPTTCASSTVTSAPTVSVPTVPSTPSVHS